MSLYEFRTHLRAKVLPRAMVKLTLVHLLLALDYLHTEAGIVHTGIIKHSPSLGISSKQNSDIQEKNIMMAIEDMSILTDFEEEENPILVREKLLETGQFMPLVSLGKQSNMAALYCVILARLV